MRLLYSTLIGRHTMHDTRVELVWNKGIAALCDRRIPDEFPDASSYYPISLLASASPVPAHPANLIANPSDYRDVRRGEVIWVRLSWLKSFVVQVLPLLENPNVLATGDADSSTPSEVLPEAWTILNSPKILYWFAQNHDGFSGGRKMSPLPIGNDFHTISERPCWGMEISSPQDQELFRSSQPWRTCVQETNEFPASTSILPGRALM